MPEPSKTESDVVKLADELTARVDAWALANATDRSDAIHRLVELGLKSEMKARRTSQQDAIAIEHRAARQLDQMIDPDTPQEERDRRIHRLTEGPPEFVDLRIDLPGRRGS
jgi:predicted transcriptional regulator